MIKLNCVFIHRPKFPPYEAIFPQANYSFCGTEIYKKTTYKITHNLSETSFISTDVDMLNEKPLGN